MSKERNTANVINFKRPQGVTTIGNNALKLDTQSSNRPQLAEVVDISTRRISQRSEAQAFRHEFYQGATRRQIEDDVVSYIAEYRLEVAEFNYTLDVVDGVLVDPASGDSMIDKARKAIEVRNQDGLSSSRERAELEGLVSLTDQIRENPNGTVVWFSPQGAEEDGYGKYGFAYVGKRNGNVLQMTAIRVDDPKIADFNTAKDALFGGEEFLVAEDFLRSPKVIDVEPDRVKEFIHGNFEIKNKEGGRVFDRIRGNLSSVINEYAQVALNGTEEEQHLALHVVENLAIELRQKYESEYAKGNVVYLTDYQLPTLAQALLVKRYIAPPPKVRGSCGSSGKTESNDIFRSIKSVAKKGSTKQRDFEFNEAGPCRLCQRDVPCGPCFVCERCNDSIDASEQAVQAA
ncbi:MAG: hypothetical protein AAB532_02050 [Patescibacteria group bacterium]